MISDANKGISSITYNHLNLPTQVTLASGNIQYIYDATGVKLRKAVNETTITDYAGNFIYENGKLKLLSHPEGYAEPPVFSTKKHPPYKYVYQYKDHLGNIRLSYRDNNGTLEILSENNYYPFGLEHKGYNGNVSANANSVASRFKYNGIELEESLGLDLYEMDFRQYDNALGRFNTVDPLAELYSQLDKSPYAFAWNNPIVFNDPLGLCPDCGEVGEEGSTVTLDNGSVYVVVNGEWERQTVEQLDEVCLDCDSNSLDASDNASLAYTGPGGLGPIVTPGTKTTPAPPKTTPSTGPGISPIGLAVVAWAVLVSTSPHPDDIEKILDPDDYSKKPRDETAVMRFQLQQGTNDLLSTIARNSAEVGVTVNQAKVGLSQLYNISQGQTFKILKTPQGQNALYKLKKKIENVRPLGVISGTRTTLQEKFIYKGKVYRIDAESIIGHNLRQ